MWYLWWICRTCTREDSSFSFFLCVVVAVACNFFFGLIFGVPTMFLMCSHMFTMMFLMFNAFLKGVILNNTMLFIPYGSPLLTYYIGGPKGTNLHLHINFFKFWGASKVSVSFLIKKKLAFLGWWANQNGSLQKWKKKKNLGLTKHPSSI